MRAAIVLILLMRLHGPWPSQQRMALHIGNEGYASEIDRLTNPHNDVALLEQVLNGLGFEVVIVSDVGLGALTRAVNAYARRLQSAGSQGEAKPSAQAGFGSCHFARHLRGVTRRRN